MRNSDTSAIGTALLFLLFAWGKRKQSSSPDVVRWTDADMLAFRQEVEPTGVPVEAALKVYAAETGLDPQASSGGAWGLPQFIESTLRSVGWTKPPEQFGRLTVAQQAPWIGKLLRMQIKQIGFVPKTPIDLYVANFSPLAAANHSDVIYRKGSANYEKNFQLDHGMKGYIDRADLALRLGTAEGMAAYKLAVAQYRRLALPAQRKAF